MKIYAATAPFPKLKGYIRDLRPVWLLEEIGAPYELEYVNAQEDVTKPWFLAMNPFGKVPVLKDGEKVVFESGAICQYIADKNEKLIPRFGSPARSIHDQWLFASIANFEFNAGRLFACDQFFDPGAETDLKRTDAAKALDNWLPALNSHLEKSAYLTGAEFQVCDLVLSTILRYAGENKYLDRYPHVLTWLKRNLARPAFQRAHEKNGGA
ncbi:MAG: glutathione S-transferase family protein [Bdellovibrionota bacterium]